MGNTCCQQDETTACAGDVAGSGHTLTCISHSTELETAEQPIDGNALPNAKWVATNTVNTSDRTDSSTAAPSEKAETVGEEESAEDTLRDPSLPVALLRKRLEAAGIDTSQYGKGKAKPLELLHHELSVLGSCWLEEGNGSIRRVVEQVQVAVVVALDGMDVVLVSAAQVLHDNRTRNQSQLLLWKIKPGQTWQAALTDACSQRLLVKQEDHATVFYVDNSTYAFREETEVSKGYPGLETTYRFHEVVMRIDDPEAEEVASLGLPEGRGFATMEGVIGTSDVSARLNVWEWHSVDDAIRLGLPIRPDKLQTAYPLTGYPSVKSFEDKAFYCVEVGPQLLLNSVPKGTKTPNSVLASLTVGTKTDWKVVARMASSIRVERYSLSDFYQDCLAAFPELRLYLGPPDGVENLDPLSPAGPRRHSQHNHVKMTSGNTSDEEYQRTFGALFAVYWLMRLDMDGKNGFTYGVTAGDSTWRVQGSRSTEVPDKPFGQLSKKEKQASFLAKAEWDSFQELFVDAGLLVPSKKKGERLKADPVKTQAMLALTAFHDIMKVEALLPKVLEEHAPVGSYKARETIGDHDIALAYVLEHFPEMLPSYSGLPKEARKMVLFTQSKMEFNHGWLVQAEGPPGKVLRPFKQVLSRNDQITPQVVAFYFVHWLTDLAGAVPTPLAGAEKFVSQFPHAVLASFLQSFPLVKRLAAEDEVKVYEDYISFRWRTSDCKKLPSLMGFSGMEQICMQRLLCMAQNAAVEVLEAFSTASVSLRCSLSMELARTGVKSRPYDICSKKPQKDVNARWDSGPAFLLYYGPAVLQKSGKADPKGVLRILDVVCKAGRSLWPLSEAWGDQTVSLRMDTLKEKPLDELKASMGDDDVWLLVRHNDSEGFVERHSRSFLLDPNNNTRPHEVLHL
mmetsp:Transcript_17067/g.30807  ORF Transcript_17067/g.30807 Transcript_17067/m.30807 type:complete len:905 (-) Transcript_17067:94-2808(-)